MADKTVKVEITAEANPAIRTLRQLQRELTNTGNGAEEASKKSTRAFGQIEDKARALQSAIAGVAMGAFITQLGRLGLESIKAANQMKRYEIAFSTMLKSADKGRRMLQQLQNFAAETPFDVPGVVQAAQQLMAFGFSAEEIIPMLRTLGDTAAGLGKSSAGVQQIAYALGQIRTSGTLKTQDINQLTTAGIDAWGALARASGQTITQVKEMTEKGMIDSLKAIDVIITEMNSNFGGMMQATAKEVDGLWNNITESMDTAKATIGAFIIDATNLKGILKSVSDEVSGIGKTLQDARNKGKSFGEAMREAFSPEVLDAMGAVAAIVGVTLVAGLGAAVAAFASFAGVTAPVIAVCGAVGVAVSRLWQNWDTLTTSINNAINALTRYIALAKERYLGKPGYSEYDSDYHDAYSTGGDVATYQGEQTSQTTSSTANVPITEIAPSIDKIAVAGSNAAETVKKQSGVVRTVSDAWQDYGRSVASGFGNAVSDMVTGSATITQALGQMLKSIIANAVQMAAQFLMLAGILSAFKVPNAGAVAVKMMFGIDPAKVQKKADGGYISGAGTSTSDSIPAMLSNGEYVLRASAVRDVGLPALNAMNRGRGFADGGLVSATPVSTSSAMATNNVTLQVSAMDASSFEGFLQTGGLDKIKQALFDSDRNFAATAGVW